MAAPSERCCGSLSRAERRGAQYRYAHNEPGAYAAGERYFPDDMPERRYYQPTERGIEARIAERIRRLADLDAKANRHAVSDPSTSPDPNKP